MKSGDLNSIVISVLNTDLGLSIKEIAKEVNQITDKEYAYTTIATILSRLEKKRLIIGRKAKLNGRKINLYYLSEQGYKKEIKNNLKSLFTKFGFGGVKHLGELLDTELDEKDILEIQKKLE